MELTAEQALEEAKGITFEKAWAILMEDRKRAEKSSGDFEKRMEKSNADFKKNTEKIIKELSKNIGGVNNTLGQFTESMFSAELCKQFETLGYQVSSQCRNKEFKENKKLIAEADVFIENGGYAIPVEIKTKLEMEDIDDHLDRMEKIRGYMDAHGDSRKLVGAVAGAVSGSKVIARAHKEGLYVIVLSGESVTIAGQPEGFKAREW